LLFFILIREICEHQKTKNTVVSGFQEAGFLCPLLWVFERRAQNTPVPVIWGNRYLLTRVPRTAVVVGWIGSSEADSPNNNAQKPRSIYLSLRNAKAAEMPAHTRGPVLGTPRTSASV